MNRFVTLSACCLMLSAGCRSTDRLTNWSGAGADDSRQSAATDQLASRIEKSNPGLHSQAATPAPQSVDERIRAGQSEFAQWQQDQQASHLAAAKAQFEAALVLAPQSSSAHHGLAIIADLERNFPEAEKHYQRALIQKPDDSEILGNMGYSYLLQNRLSESEQYSLRAVQASPANQSATKHLGDAYARQGKTELALQTYGKLYPPEEAQRVLAENSPPPATPSALKTNPSLMDRFIPGKSPGEKLAADIQQRQQEYQENLKKYGQPGRRPMTAQPVNQERLAHERMLRQQLQAIDQEGAASAPTGPLLIDDQTGRLTRLPGADERRSWPQPGMQGPQFASMNIPNQPYPNPRGEAGNPAMLRPDLVPMTAGNVRGDFQNQAGMSQSTVQSPVPQGSPTGQGFDSNSGRWNTGSPVQNAYAPGPAASPQAWSGIQQTAGGPSQNQESAVRQAYQQFPEGFRQQVEPVAGQYGTPNAAGPGGNYGAPPNPANAALPSHQMTPYGGIPSQGPPQFAQGAGVPGGQGTLVNSPAGGPASPPGDAYAQASKAAARMGMGVGPGAMFPVSNQPGQINPPGSMSYDSANVAAPQRWMPDTVPPQNLNDAYQPYPNPVRPPSYTQGGQMPPSVTPSYSKEQFGTASRYDTQTLQNSNIPQDYNSSMRDYEAQRWAAGREANVAVQEIWNQGPINSPQSPSSGSIYTYPDTQGMMYTPNVAGPNGQVIPEQWPHQPYAPQGDPQQSANTQPQQQYSNNASPNGNQSWQQQSGPASGNPGDNLSVPLVNDQYGNNQYNVNVPNSRNNMRNMTAAPAAAGRNNVVVPSEYRMSAPAQTSPNRTNAVVPAAATDSSAWPTIIPASR